MYMWKLEEMSAKLKSNVYPLARKSIFVIFALFTLIGCCFQLIHLCMLFFDYPTNVHMKTRFDVLKKELPALTFCKGVGKDHHAKSSTELFDGYSHRNFLREISFRYTEEGTEQDLSHYIDNVVETISLKYYCFTINSLLKVNKSIVLEENSSLRVRLVNHDKHSKTNWFLLIHDSYDQLSSYDWNSAELKQGFWYSLTFSLRSYHSLQSPYPTDCLHYRQSTPFLSRKDCVKKCRIKESVANCKVVSHYVDLMRGEPDVEFANSSAEENCVTKLNVKSLCSHQCRHSDCLNKYYQPKILAGPNQIRTNKRVTEVNVFIPTEPETNYYHKASIESIEFICFLASTLSIWFGFSVLSTFEWFSSVAKVLSTNSIRKMSKYMTTDSKDKMVLIKDCVINILYS